MNPSIPLPRRRAFTLIELLVVIAIIAVLAALIFPVYGRVRSAADSTKCTSNLRQIGIGINAYMNDNDNFFPGPLWYGQSPWYNRNDTGSLPFRLEKYLNLMPNQEWNQRADVFVCPAYESAVRIRSAPVYITQDIAGVRPWGDRNPPQTQPLRRPVISTLVDKSGKPASMSTTVAIRDIDQDDYKTGSKPGWFDQLPSKPVHITHQNALFFDWHMGKIDPVTKAVK
ncbi:MAG: DUF1559 domain-containing protein [Verrucomicrobiota bacterium]|nr:DUF1559 domain-containing protein [Verrucomicrobiota bacterium]